MTILTFHLAYLSCISVEGDAGDRDPGLREVGCRRQGMSGERGNSIFKFPLHFQISSNFSKI